MTRDEMLQLLRYLSRLDGFMWSLNNSSANMLIEEGEYLIDILVKSILSEEKSLPKVD